MKRVQSSTSSLNSDIKRPHLSNEKGVVCAVFETSVNGNPLEKEITIYKFDSVEDATASKSVDGRIVHDFPRLIWAAKASVYPMAMFYFSVGSKLYFCGGFISGDTSVIFQTGVYMIDINEGNCHPILIQSMKSPKSDPYVFGPIDDKVYVFSSDIFQESFESFEMFHAKTGMWETFENPPNESGIPMRFEHPNLCGSNILISSFSFGQYGLHVYCTKSAKWRTLSGEALSDEDFQETKIFRFWRTYSIYDDKNVNVFLGATEYKLPRVYMSRKCKDHLGLVGSFKHVGDVKSLSGILGRLPTIFGGPWGNIHNFYYFNKNKTICVVRFDQRPVFGDIRFVIDICNVSSLVEDNSKGTVKVEVEVVNTFKYAHCRSELEVLPQYFFAI